MYQNYIFDLYGTLVDIHTNEKKDYLWEKLALCFGFYGASYDKKELKQSYLAICKKLEAQYQAVEEYPELPLENAFSMLLEQKGVTPKDSTITALMTFMRVLSIQFLTLYDGVTDLLSSIHNTGGKIYLLSNAQSLFTRPELAYLGIDSYFDGIMISSEEHCKKPGFHFYEHLLKNYELDPKESIMIGNDAIADIKGAREMGLDTLYIHSDLSPDCSEIPNCTYAIMDGDVKKIKGYLL